MTEDKKIDAADRAADAVLNQTATMWHERWIAANRIYALKAEMTRRAAVILAIVLIATPAFAQHTPSPKYTQVGPDCVETSASGTRIARGVICTQMAGRWSTYTGWEVQ